MSKVKDKARVAFETGFPGAYLPIEFCALAARMRQVSKKLPRFRDNTVDPREVIRNLTPEDYMRLRVIAEKSYHGVRGEPPKNVERHLVGVNTERKAVVNHGCGSEPDNLPGVLNYDPFHIGYTEDSGAKDELPVYSKDVMVRCDAIVKHRHAFGYHIVPDYQEWERRKLVKKGVKCAKCRSPQYDLLVSFRTKSFLVSGSECDLRDMFQLCEPLLGGSNVLVRWRENSITVKSKLRDEPYMDFGSNILPATSADVLQASHFYPKIDGKKCKIVVECDRSLMTVSYDGKRHVYDVEVDVPLPLNLEMICERVGDVVYPVYIRAAGVNYRMSPDMIRLFHSQVRFDTKECGFEIRPRPMHVDTFVDLEGLVCLDAAGYRQAYVKTLKHRCLDLDWGGISKLSHALGAVGLQLKVDMEKFEGVVQFVAWLDLPFVTLTKLSIRDDKSRSDSVAKCLDILQYGTVEDYIISSLIDKGGEHDYNEFIIREGKLLYFDAANEKFEDFKFQLAVSRVIDVEGDKFRKRIPNMQKRNDKTLRPSARSVKEKVQRDRNRKSK